MFTLTHIAKTIGTSPAVVLVVFLNTMPLSAQTSSGPGGVGPGWGPGTVMGPGMMRGPGMWGRGGFGGFCNPRMAGFAEWRINQIERAVKPTDVQRKALDELRAASTKAAEKVAGACPRDIPATISGRLAFMETRMDAMLQAIKIVRPAFDAFYATLDDKQKSRLDAVGPRRWGWTWWRSGGR